jgi:WD40 repeat protein
MSRTIFQKLTLTLIITFMIVSLQNNAISQAADEAKPITVDNAAELKKVNEWAVDGQIQQIAVHPDGEVLAVGTVKGALMLQDLTTGKEIRTFTGLKGGVAALAFSRDGKLLASGAGDTVTIWDVASGKSLASLKGHIKYVRSLAISTDGKMIATVGCDTSGKGKCLVRLWNLPGGKLVKALDSADSVAFNDNNLFLGSKQGLIKYDVAKKSKVDTLEIGAYELLMVPDGSKAIVSGEREEMQIVELSSGKVLTSVRVPLNKDAIAGVDALYVNPDASIVITKEMALGAKIKNGKIDLASMHWMAGNELVTLWNAETGEMLAELGLDKSLIPEDLVFTPDGAALVVAVGKGGKGSIQIWAVEE